MENNMSLFEGKLIYLTSLDPDQDAEVESRWTHNLEYMRLLGLELARPLSPAQVKKRYEKLEKEMYESGNQFYFAIRARADGLEEGAGNPKGFGSLIGFVKLYWVVWTHSAAMVSLGIGDSNERGKGYGGEALQLILGYAFNELNLYRLGAVVPEYNQAALRLFQRADFIEEVRQREAIHHDGQRWDMVHMGLLREDWKQKKEQ